MTPRSLKTGARAQRAAYFFITLKTGDVLDLTIYVGECLQGLFAVLKPRGGDENTSRPAESARVESDSTPPAAAFCGQKGEPVPQFLLGIFGISEDRRARCACMAAVNTCTQVQAWPFEGAPKALRDNAASVTCNAPAMPRHQDSDATASKRGANATLGRIIRPSNAPDRYTTAAQRLDNGWRTVPEAFDVTHCHARSRGVTVRTVDRELRTVPPCYEHARRMPLARLWQSHGSAMAHAIQTHPKPEAAS